MWRLGAPSLVRKVGALVIWARIRITRKLTSSHVCHQTAPTAAARATRVARARARAVARATPVVAVAALPAAVATSTWLPPRTTSLHWVPKPGCCIATNLNKNQNARPAADLESPDERESEIERERVREREKVREKCVKFVCVQDFGMEWTHP